MVLTSHHLAKSSVGSFGLRNDSHRGKTVQQPEGQAELYEELRAGEDVPHQMSPF